MPTQTEPKAAGEAPARGRGGWGGAEAVDYAMTDAERLRDAIDTPFHPGAREVRADSMRYLLKELGAG